MVLRKQRVALLSIFTWFAPILSLVFLVDGTRAGATAQLPPLSVSGKHILRNGVVFNFYGVNRDTLEWGANNWGGCGGDGHFADADFDNLVAWNINTVRIPLSQANWLGRRCDAAAYQTLVDTVVARANAHHLYAILDLHWSDVEGRAPCDAACPTGQQPMPDADSLVFWRQVAARYGSNPGVLFNLYNEPHGVSWDCWKNGGCSVLSDPNTNGGVQVSYTVVGMQQLYNVVRSQAPTSLILIGGLDWGYDLSGIGAGYAIAGANIVYDTHVYTQWHTTTADWDRHFGYLTAQYPVSSTEFGSVGACDATITKPLLDYFNAPMGVSSNRMSWTIWSWNTPGDCRQPSVIADWNGTPLGAQGHLIHDTLVAYPPTTVFLPTVTATMAPTVRPAPLPFVTISSPANGATVTNSITVAATTRDNIRTARVRFFLDGRLLGTDTVAPYTIRWNTRTSRRGPHVLSVQAEDAAANLLGSASARITLK